MSITLDMLLVHTIQVLTCVAIVMLFLRKQILRNT